MVDRKKLQKGWHHRTVGLFCTKHTEQTQITCIDCLLVFDTPLRSFLKYVTAPKNYTITVREKLCFENIF